MRQTTEALTGEEVAALLAAAVAVEEDARVVLDAAAAGDTELASREEVQSMRVRLPVLQSAMRKLRRLLRTPE